MSTESLSRERILAAAVEFADEVGVDKVSMRKLADRLGVGTMSLYNHVANKDEMLVEMVDLVCEQIEWPDDSQQWRAAITNVATSTHRVLMQHPWAADEWIGGRMPGPKRFELLDAILATLERSGLHASLVYRGYHAVTMHIVGYTIQEIGYARSLGDRDLAEMAAGLVEGMADSGLASLARHVQEHISGNDHGDEFGFVLDLLLDGLERENRRLRSG